MANPTDDTFKATVKMLGDLLIARRDVMAVEFNDGTGWKPDPHPFTLSAFRKHFAGERTLGTYMVDRENRVRFFALDIDLLKDGKVGTYYDLLDPEPDDNGGLEIDVAHEGPIEIALHDPTNPAYRWVRVVLRAQLDAFAGIIRAQFGLESLKVLTGGGAHLLVPLPEPTYAKRIRSDVIDTLGQYRYRAFRGKNFFVCDDEDPDTATTTIEVFPKQDDMDGKEFGNLIRLPLGVHRRTGFQTRFIKEPLDGKPAWELPTIKAHTALAEVTRSLGREVPE